MNNDGKFLITLGVIQGLVGLFATIDGYGLVGFMMAFVSGVFIHAAFGHRE